MVSLLELPTELLCYLFTYADTPSDYYRLCTIHPLFHHIGRSFNTRYAFLSRTLVDDAPWESTNSNNNGISFTTSHDQLDLYRSTLCRFLASSPIPLSSVFAIDLLELVPTTHFCQFMDYPNNNIKGTILQAFRAHGSYNYHSHYRRQRRRIPPIDNNNNFATTNKAIFTIPTLVNKTTMATATACHRHRVIGGAPRRVYYHVTLRNPATSIITAPDRFTGTTLFTLLHDTDTVIAFDDQLNCHHGKLWYEDEGIITDSSWHHLLDIGDAPQSDYRDLRTSPVGYYDTYKTSHHRGWRPCLLQTLYKCYLKQDVRKGGLKKGDYFDCVFVYEHREDDTICLEFCLWDEYRRRWTPQGFLLLAEHHITWDS